MSGDGLFSNPCEEFFPSLFTLVSVKNLQKILPEKSDSCIFLLTKFRAINNLLLKPCHALF